MKTLTLIPARLGSTRLPNKPLADICGKPMIVHVADRAAAAALGQTVVATDSDEIYATVRAHGHEAVLTRSDHESGSDRIYEALEKLDPTASVDFIINVQGDLPTIDPQTIRRSYSLLLKARLILQHLASRSRRKKKKPTLML